MSAVVARTPAARQVRGMRGGRVRPSMSVLPWNGGLAGARDADGELRSGGEQGDGAPGTLGRRATRGNHGKPATIGRPEAPTCGRAPSDVIAISPDRNA